MDDREIYMMKVYRLICEGLFMRMEGGKKSLRIGSMGSFVISGDYLGALLSHC
jgi:hypothetical protein